MYKRLFLLGAILFSVLFASHSLAGEGQISGKVKDIESKEGLPGANVMLTGLVFEGIEIDIATPIGSATDIEGK